MTLDLEIKRMEPNKPIIRDSIADFLSKPEHQIELKPNLLDYFRKSVEERKKGEGDYTPATYLDAAKLFVEHASCPHSDDDEEEKRILLYAQDAKTEDVVGVLHYCTNITKETKNRLRKDYPLIFPDESTLENLAEGRYLLVDKDYRNKTIFKRLAVEAVNYLKKRGVSGIFLKTELSNIHAQKVYTSLGFEEIGRIELDPFRQEFGNNDGSVFYKIKF